MQEIKLLQKSQFLPSNTEQQILFILDMQSADNFDPYLIDLTKQEGLLTHIYLRTNFIRQQIIARRQKKHETTQQLLKDIQASHCGQPQKERLKQQLLLKLQLQEIKDQPRITYKLKYPPIRIRTIDGDQEFFKGNIQRIKEQTISDVAQITISTNTLYPIPRGQVHSGVANNPTVDQACIIKIKDKDKVVVGLVYPLDENNLRFIDWIGILVAEQIRFNTAYVLQEQGKYLLLEDLAKQMFRIFKIENDIYNDWVHGNFPKNVILPNGQTKQVMRLVKKI